MDIEERKRNIIRRALTSQSQNESTSIMSIVLFACFIATTIIVGVGLALPIAVGYIALTSNFAIVLAISLCLSILFFVGYVRRAKCDAKRFESRKTELFNIYDV